RTTTASGRHAPARVAHAGAEAVQVLPRRTATAIRPAAMALIVRPAARPRAASAADAPAAIAAALLPRAIRNAAAGGSAGERILRRAGADVRARVDLEEA